MPSRRGRLEERWKLWKWQAPPQWIRRACAKQHKYERISVNSVLGAARQCAPIMLHSWESAVNAHREWHESNKRQQKQRRTVFGTTNRPGYRVVQRADKARMGRTPSLTTPVQNLLDFIWILKGQIYYKYINCLSISPNNERAQPIHALTPICGNPMYSKYFVHIAQIEAIFCTAWFLVSWTYIYYSILGYVNLC